MPQRPQPRNQNQGGHRQQRPGSGAGNATPPCPPDITKEGMQAISAPYNFVPLAAWVHLPEWGRAISHDLPFRDGYSGEIVYRLVADSPLLVGGTQQKPANDQPGLVRPFRLPNGRYAIPGSSLKGMLRSVIEIAGFGRMRMVDDGRPGLRDISGNYVKQSYTAKVRDRVKTGFLRRGADGGQEIVPCRMARLDHRTLEDWLSIGEPIFKTQMSVADKYRQWRRVCQTKGRNPDLFRFTENGRDAVPAATGGKEGVPVFTGQISDSTRRNGKRRDFVFYDRDPAHAIPVSDATWRDFLAIHRDDLSGRAANGMSWPDYWKGKFRTGKQVPVFYVQDGDLLRIGLAYMPKLAGDFTIHEMIGHSSAAHAQGPGAVNGYDLADLLFGSINGKIQSDALRGRVSLEMAMAEGDTPPPQQQPDTILNGPKPTYFPNYVVQRADPAKGILKSGQYATYIETQQSKKPELRGFKRYPARDLVKLQCVTPDQTKNVQVRLHTLKKGTHFNGRIVYHNLKPEELGALLWALTWGGNDKLRHGLGMGKSFGFGQVRFELDPVQSHRIPNDPAQDPGPLSPDLIRDAIQCFERHMEASADGNGGWRQSPQLANLLAMAEPEAANDLPAGMELRHMWLAAKQKINEFQWAKQREHPGPFVLVDYAQATGRGAAGTGPAPTGGGARASSALHPWVQSKVAEIMKKNNAKEDDTLRGKGLAGEWRAIEDADLKAQVLASIRALWEARGWWADTQGGSAKKAKAIYESGG